MGPSVGTGAQDQGRHTSQSQDRLLQGPRGGSGAAESSRTPSVPRLAVLFASLLWVCQAAWGGHYLPAFSLCVGQATAATWRSRNLGLWPLGKMARPARILVSFLLSKLKPCARWQMSVACVTVQEGQREHWPKHPPPSALMPRQRGTSWAGLVASPVADAGAAASQCRQVLRGRPAWVTDPRLRCPGEPAFCTFSISDLRQHSCTNVAFLGAVQGAGCRVAE